MRTSSRSFLIALVLGVLPALPICAQNPDYVFSLTDAEGPGGSTQTVQVQFDVQGTEGLQAWSFSVCHDPGVITPMAASEGADVVALNGGDGPDIYFVDVTPAGVRMIIVVDVLSVETLSPGINLEILDIDYTLDGPIGSVTEVAFCDSVGDPPTVTIAAVGNEAVIPVQTPGSVTITFPGPSFTYTCPSPTVGFDSTSGFGSFAVEPTIVEENVSPSFPNATYGFSMGLAHDPDFLAAVGAEPAGPLPALNGGTGPEFFGVITLPDGITIGVVYAVSSPVTLLFDSEQPVVGISYETNPVTLQGVTVPVFTDLVWSDQLGNPVVDNLVVISLAGDTAVPDITNGTITLSPAGPFFTRGDCNGDNVYTIGDPVALLGILFSGFTAACASACDGNDDGALDVGDAIYILNNQFLSGPNPPTPYPQCGSDPTNDSLDCNSFPPCQ